MFGHSPKSYKELHGVEAPGVTFEAAFNAAKAGQVAVVRQFLEKNLAKINDLHTTPSGDYSLLHIAAEAGKIEVVELLIEKKAEHRLQATKNLGLLFVGGRCTTYAAHLAAENGHLDVLRLLLDLGLNIELTDGFGNSLLYAAIASRLSEAKIVPIVQFLLSRGADTTRLLKTTAGGHDKTVNAALYAGDLGKHDLYRMIVQHSARNAAFVANMPAILERLSALEQKVVELTAEVERLKAPKPDPFELFAPKLSPKP